MSFRIGTALLSLALVAAACSGASSTTSTTSGRAAATSTTATSGHTDTTSLSTTTSTVAPTTTTTTAPLLDTFLVAGKTCMLGWSDGPSGNWSNEGVPPVTGGEEYQVVRLDEPITNAFGTDPQPWCEPLDLLNVQFDPPLAGDFQELDAIGIQTSSDVRPHPIEFLSNSNEAYVEATANLLAGKVAAVPIINNTQVIRTDLEGDGVMEVIVAASTVPDGFMDTAPGAYSILYLRKIIEGDIQTAILGESIITSFDDLPQNIIIYEVAAVADLNGDGKMEIVVNGRVWEGAFLEAWEYVNDDVGPVKVLSCGCGL
ncbi:MAG: hypothetical protein P1T08_01520 [Acidimicrobiia bacterium]|nr:hypothetical protein [Acidimicrobiia bacterium]